jgi:hypothetical protein
MPQRGCIYAACDTPKHAGSTSYSVSASAAREQEPCAWPASPWQACPRGSAAAPPRPSTPWVAHSSSAVCVRQAPAGPAALRCPQRWRSSWQPPRRWRPGARSGWSIGWRRRWPAPARLTTCTRAQPRPVLCAAAAVEGPPASSRFFPQRMRTKACLPPAGGLRVRPGRAPHMPSAPHMPPSWQVPAA